VIDIITDTVLFKRMLKGVGTDGRLGEGSRSSGSDTQASITLVVPTSFPARKAHG